MNSWMDSLCRKGRLGVFATIALLGGRLLFAEPELVPELVLTVPTDKGMSQRLAELVEESIEGWKSEGDVESVWRLADLYHANGYTDRAVVAYDWLADRSGDEREKARIYYRLAAIDRERGNIEGARESLEKSVSLFPEYALSHFYLAEARYKLGDKEGAVNSYEAALELDPMDTFALLGLARARLQGGDEESALGMLEEVIRIDPDNFNARSLLAQLLSRRGEPERAAELRTGANRAWDVPREDPWLEPVVEAIYDPQRLSFRFEDYKRVGEFEEALRYLDRIEEIDPQKSDTYLLRGQLYTDMGKPDLALRSFRGAIDRGGDPNVLYPLLVKSLENMGRRAEAEAIAAEGVRAAPDGAKVLADLAQFRFEKGDLEGAMDLLNRAVAIDPYDTEALLLFVRCSLRMGDLDLVVPKVEMLRQLAASNVSTQVMLGLVHMEAGMFAEAIEPLETALRIAPGNREAVELLADAHFQIGRLAAAKGRLEEAMSRFDSALEINPLNEEAALARIQLFASGKRLPEAEQAMRELVRIKPRDAGLLLSYGDLLFANGKAAEARSQWQRALGFALNDSDAAFEQAASLRLRQTQ